MSDDTPQNVYDDPTFFAGYTGMERFGAGWRSAMEYADFMALLPDPAGRRVLDLGCGAGRLALHLAEAWAAEVVATDVSERMLAVVRAECAHPRIEHRLEAMERLVFPDERFDLVVSSLAFHYVADYSALVGRIAGWLAPGGVLVFSTEHPIYTARATDDGWQVGADGQRIAWALDRYHADGPREQRWFVDGVRRYHRSVSTLVNGLLEAGLVLERLLEPSPTPDWLREHRQSADEARRPMFLIVRARKE